MYQFALIGCGSVAVQHIEQITKHGTLAAVCDTDSEKADAFAERYAVPAFYSIDELLEGGKQIDVVVVCTPNGCHAEHCIKSLQAGHHVLCEAPLCLTAAAAWQMIETEKYCGRRLFVVHAAERNGLLDEVRSIIRENAGDQLLNFELECEAPLPDAEDWRAQAFPGGRALHAHFSGAIDVVSYLFRTIEEAKGVVIPVDGEKDTSGEVELRMKNGSGGLIRWSLKEGAERKNHLEIKAFEQPVWSADMDKFTRDGDRYYGVYQQFFSEVENRESPSPSLLAATRSVEAIEKIYTSISSTTSPSS